MSKTGSIFYSVLTERPRSLSTIVDELSAIFTKTSPNDIKIDAEEFFKELSKDGFVGCICDENILPSDTIFSYECKTPYKLTETDEIVDSDDLLKVYSEEYRLARVHINVCGPCNEHCVHCYFPTSYRKSLMSQTQFITILEQCKQCNVLNITLSGGEPMLNPKLPFFIDKCRENNFSINILSNLTLLTDNLLAKFKDTPLLSIQTSLYSMNSEVHDSITKVKGSFEKTKHAIEIIRQHNIPLQINCPIMKQNINTYHDVLNWAKSLNIEANSDYMLFGCIDGSGCNLGCRLDLSEVKMIIERDVRIHGSKKTISENHNNRTPEHSVCPVCLNSLCVSYNGDVYPCEGWQGMCLGNVNDIPLGQLWSESMEVKNLRMLTMENDFPQCLSCEDREYCSLCLIRNANESPTGNFKELNPYFCKIAKMKRIMSNK